MTLRVDGGKDCAIGVALGRSRVVSSFCTPKTIAMLALLMSQLRGRALPGLPVEPPPSQGDCFLPVIEEVYPG